MNFRQSTLFVLAFFTLTLRGGYIYCQNDTLNQTDEKEWKQGYWIITNTGDGLLEGCQEGAKIAEGRFLNNRRAGSWKEYHCNGKIKSLLKYLPDGAVETKTFYPNGQPQEEGTWKNATWVGPYKFYYESGKLYYNFQFSDNGKRTGFQKYYYENGNTMYEGEWLDSKESGMFKEYWPDGSLKAEKYFQDGKLDVDKVKNYDQPKVVQSANVVKEDNVQAPKEELGIIKDGYNKTYNPDRTIDREGEFLSGKLIQGKKYFYKDGKVHKIDLYREGKVVKSEYVKDKEPGKGP